VQYNIQVAVVTGVRITTIITATSLILSITLALILPQAAHAKVLDRLRSSAVPVSVQLKRVSRHTGRSYAAPFLPSQSYASLVNSQTERANESTPESTTATTTSSEPSPVVTTATSSPSPATVAVVARETFNLENLRLTALIAPLSLKTSPQTVTTAGSVSHASFVPLHTSEKGWELFGVAWYWWTFAAAISGSGLYAFRRFMAPRNLI